MFVSFTARPAEVYLCIIPQKEGVYTLALFIRYINISCTFDVRNLTDDMWYSISVI